MSEKKREKTEKKKRKPLLPDYSPIQSTLTATASVYKTLVESSGMQEYLKTMRETWKTTLDQHMAVLQSVAPYLGEIQRMRELYLGALNTQVMKPLMQVRRESQRLLQQISEVNRMVISKVPSASIIPIARAIPSVAKSTIEGLARHVALLEEELAKEKEEKKELIRIIDEMRKKLKKKYVA